jgi:transcriptional regulator PpsR
MTRLANSHRLVGGLDAGNATRLVRASSDIALVLDDAGVIVDMAVQDSELPAETVNTWLGRPWVQTVTLESRQKVQAMLRDALAAAGVSRWRQVNHPGPVGTEDLPLMVATVRLGEPGAGAVAAPGAGTAESTGGAMTGAAVGAAAGAGSGRIVVVGRSLLATVALQRRLVQAQQTMERDYWRFREAETRYRHLFQTSSEAVLIVDGLSQKVLEANPAARALCGDAHSKLVGAALASLFAPQAAEGLQAMLAGARSSGRRDSLRAPLADGATAVQVAASVFRQDDSAFVLVRLLPVPAEAGRQATHHGAEPAEAMLQDFVRSATDALVFTDTQGRVLAANPAFVALAQLGHESEARGQMLDRWVGRTGVELGVLMANLRQRGSAGLFLTVVRSEFGGNTDVEIASSLLQQGEETALAFAIRNIERRLKAAHAASKPITRTVGDLAELVGNVPLKDIVSETTDLIEQLCIEAALQMTGDKRASAALLLGLSRQSLYVKLRRFGIAADPGADDD